MLTTKNNITRGVPAKGNGQCGPWNSILFHLQFSIPLSESRADKREISSSLSSRVPHHLTYHKCIPIDTHFGNTEKLLTSISRTRISHIALLIPLSGKEKENANLPLPLPPPTPHPNPHPRHQAHNNLPRLRHRLLPPNPSPRPKNLRLLRRSLQRRSRRPRALDSRLRPSMGRAIQILLFDARFAGQ